LLEVIQIFSLIVKEDPSYTKIKKLTTLVWEIFENLGRRWKSGALGPHFEEAYGSVNSCKKPVM